MEMYGQVMLNISEELFDNNQHGLSKRDWEAWATETYHVPVRRLRSLMLKAPQLKTRVNNISVKKT
eukprot:15594900-Heterocapsa_arctica.AAC.1